MSDNWLQLVPENPQFRPTFEAAGHARALLVLLLPEADEVRASFKDSVELFHPEGNWSGVMCPACGADAEDWWLRAVDIAYERAFSDLTATADCCGASVSLNDLRYISPAAFGSFCLEAMNPNLSGFPVEHLRRLEAVLGTPLRAIWVRI